MRPLRIMLVASILAPLVSPADAGDLRLFAPAPQASVTLRPPQPAATQADPVTAPDMRGTQREAGPNALLAGTDARWPESASQENAAAAEAPWQVAAQNAIATAAPKSIVSPIASQPWQVAPQASAAAPAR